MIICVMGAGIGMPAALGTTEWGLGLPLIPEFVEKANGSVKGQSTEGRGSSFIIERPLQEH